MITYHLMFHNNILGHAFKLVEVGYRIIHCVIYCLLINIDARMDGTKPTAGFKRENWVEDFNV